MQSPLFTSKSESPMCSAELLRVNGFTWGNSGLLAVLGFVLTTFWSLLSFFCPRFNIKFITVLFYFLISVILFYHAQKHTKIPWHLKSFPACCRQRPMVCIFRNDSHPLSLFGHAFIFFPGKHLKSDWVHLSERQSQILSVCPHTTSSHNRLRFKTGFRTNRWIRE